MKKFKVNFGIQRLDSDFDEIYTESKFYKFPEVKDLPNQMKVEVNFDIKGLKLLEQII